MQTFDQHLVALIRDGVVTLDAAMAASTIPHDLTVELRRLGPRRLALERLVVGRCRWATNL